MAPLDYSNYLSDKGKMALPDGIRGLFPLEKHCKVSFLAGKPNPETFPFSSMTLHLKPPLETPVSLQNGSSSQEVDVNGDKRADGGVDLEIEGADMEEALQYQTAQLKRELDNQATGEVTREEVNALRGDVNAQGVQEVPWRVTVGGGCQDLLFKAFGAIFNPGDSILVETPVYAGVISQFMTLHVNQIEVQVDDQGVSPDSLRQVLGSWPADKPKPKAIYLVPVGSNPTGCSSTTERKLEVLKICVENGIMIIEDDPYYFLAADRRPSYFQLETQVVPEGGHVIRFDSFSKVLSSGMRLGFAAGPEAILKAMDVASSTANLQPNGVAQAVALRLLRYWGIQGFIDHCERVAAFYAKRRDKFEAIARKHLDGIATWVSPVAGMFLWIDVSPIDDSSDLVQKEARELGVLAVPGFAFLPNHGKSSFLRVSFSIVDMDNKAELGFELLSQAIRQRLERLRAEGKIQ
ncbi:pyridoxal phosphate-dependent transferase [Filobasidium floriforme]|uniref:pyridoxal phosphate-dependent transferase n=1 Tax=Filobasidium floriforme TaxID=5210 RepID=UPI001E8E776F|nr:pyridoxal phosphate-dependent transferase [Filobasidium floriforme]KAH8081806.1 pyridoxal phosphate-dependent transferase [Filobasidium floriforme]